MSSTLEPTPSSVAPTNSALSERLAFRLYKLGELLYASLDERLAQMGLTGRMYFILGAADQGKGALSQQDLSRVLGIDPTTIVAIVDDLEAAGFAERVRSDADRRRYELRVTTAGGTALAAANVLLDEVEHHFFGTLAERDYSKLNQLAGAALAPHWPVNAAAASTARGRGRKSAR